MTGPVFSVFTATFNRAHTLHRVHDSLSAQTLTDIEWLVVDDGSTDGTRALVERWAQTTRFPIRYFWQPNSGKHIAYNRAITEARGEFFTLLDSDDACEPHALARFLSHWESIPQHERELFSGVGCLCRDQFGTIIGRQFPHEPFDAGVRDLYYRHHVYGEKWGMQRTDVVKRFPFPALTKTKFIPEAVVWNEISKQYRLRWVNEPLRIYYVNDFETGASLSRRGSPRENAVGRLYYCSWLLDHDLDYFFSAPVPFLKAATLLPIVSEAAGVRFRDELRSLRSWGARVLVLAAYPFSIALKLWDNMRRREVRI